MHSINAFLLLLLAVTTHAISFNYVKRNSLVRPLKVTEHPDDTPAPPPPSTSFLEAVAKVTVPDFIDLNMNSNVYNRPVNDRFDDIVVNNDVGANLFTVAGGLPSGLCISNRGVIRLCSTTWTVAQAPTQYTVNWQKTTTGVTGSTAVSIGGCKTAPPKVEIWSLGRQQALSSATLTYGSPITIPYFIGIPNGGCAATDFSVSPALPAGLELEECGGIESGNIIGTPTVVQPATVYTISATNKWGTTTTTFTIIINPAVPSNLIYTSNITASWNQPIAPISPVSVDGGPLSSLSYTISPALPSGLVIDSKTGVISGTPLVAPVSLTQYVITGSNSAGSTKTVITIVINVVVPSSLTLTATSLSLVYGTMVTKSLVQSIRGGPPSSIFYSINPTLPLVLGLNASNGVLSGVPGDIQSPKPYVLTASNIGGSVGASLSIEILPAAPYSLVLSAVTIVATYNVAITPVTVSSVSGGPASTLKYTITPSLPAGLSINPTTGVISGTPTTIDILRTYTVTASNSAGLTSVTITVIVNQAPPTKLVLSVTSISGTYKVPITPVTVVSVDGGPITTVTFSVAPALPDGLTFDDRGTISGSPAVAPFQGTFTVTAENQVGKTTATLTVTIAVAAPRDLVYSTNSLVATYGVAVTALYVAKINGGPLSSFKYSIAPSLPAGLSFDTSNGYIVGTPTVIATLQQYVVTVSNTAGSTTAQISIQVNYAIPSFLSYTPATSVCIYSTTITNMVPKVSGGPTFTYTISPALPAGIAINSQTGVISGLPTVLSPVATYTVTASNPAGSTTVSITLRVDPAPPSSLTLSASSILAVWGVAIAPVSPSSVSGGPLSTLTYSIKPDLPTGLTLNLQTGVISGTPTQVKPSASYVYTATNSAGSTSVTISVGVTDAAPSALVYTQTTIVITYLTSVSITVKSVNGGPPANFAYTITPELPSGLLFSPAAGSITGIATALSPVTTYTVKVSNPTGFTTATLTISVVPAAPSNLIYNAFEITAVFGTAIAPLTPIKVTGGPLSSLTYSISPALSSGLTFDTTTGIISGNPSLVQVSTVYTVTATNSAGQTTVKITITVQAKAPTFSYPSSSYTFSYGVSISPISPLVNNGGAAVFFDGKLPNGLTVNANTGIISGTPQNAPLDVSVTITASNAGGSTSVTLKIVVNVVAPTNLQLTAISATLTFGVAVWQDISVKVVSGGPLSSLTFDVSPALPTGLTINPSTGAITGTPSQVPLPIRPISYTVSASNTAGKASAIVTLTVLEAAPSGLQLSSTVISGVYNQAITSVTVTKVNGGPASNFVYTISPQLPLGLSLSSIGTISGTPKQILNQNTFVVTVANSAGSAYTTISIVVTEAAPCVADAAGAQCSINPPPVTYTLLAEVTVTPFAPLIIFGTPIETLTFQVSPGLPSCLDFDSANGMITGTPKFTQPATLYTAKAFNSKGSTTITFYITIIARKPVSLAYPSSTFNFFYDTAIGTLSPSVTDTGEQLTFTAQPALPSGLSINSASGLISGTPAVVVANQQSTITATNSKGSVTASLTFTVSATAPKSLRYTTTANYINYGDSVNLSPVSVLGGPMSSLTFSVVPPLPTGLSINPSTGVLSGKAQGLTTGVQSYQIFGSNSVGNSSVQLTFQIFPSTPSELKYSVSSIVITAGSACNAQPLSVTGGPLSTLSYSITPGLPAGLSFNPSTGAITGTPTSISALVTYTITARNEAGTTSTSITITINPAPCSSIAYGSNTLSVAYQTPVATPFVPTITGCNDGLTYSVTPALPAGLSLNQKTGEISGTISVFVTSSVHSVTVTNVAGTKSVTITISTAPSAPSNLYYSVSTLSLIYSTSIVNIYPDGVSGGPMSTLTFSVLSGALPSGLSLASDGRITGTPSVVATSVSVTIKCSNSAGSTSAVLTFSISPLPVSQLSYPYQSTINTGAPIAWFPKLVGGPASTVKFSSASTFPLGLTLDTNSGAITGTPTKTGKYTITISASNSATSCVPSATLVFTIQDPPTYCDLNANPCLNGGACSSSTATVYTCYCTNGYTGQNCQTAPPTPCPAHTSIYFEPNYKGSNDRLYIPSSYGITTLNANERITSASGRFFVLMRPDCSLVLYDTQQNSKVLWTSNAANNKVGCKAVVGADGRLRVVDASNAAVWTSDRDPLVSTSSQRAIYVIQNDGNFVAYQCSTPYWASNTWTFGASLASTKEKTIALNTHFTHTPEIQKLFDRKCAGDDAEMCARAASDPIGYISEETLDNIRKEFQK